MKRVVAALLVVSMVVAGCERATVVGPSPLQPSAVQNTTAADTQAGVNAAVPGTESLTPPSVAPVGHADLARFDLRSLDEDGLQAQVTTDDGVTRTISITGAASGGLGQLSIDDRPVCLSGTPCVEPDDRIKPQAVVPVIVAAVALALAVDAAWSFWRNCAAVARAEKARTGQVSWRTVGDCYTQAAFIIAGGRIGKYLKSRGVRTYRQAIESTLRGAVPQDQLLTLFNSKNFSTTAGVVGDLAGKFIEWATRGLYNLLRR